MRNLHYIAFCVLFCTVQQLAAQELHFNPDTAFTAPGGLAKIQIELSPPADIEPEVVDLSTWRAQFAAEDTLWHLGWQRLGTKWIFPIRAMFFDTGFVDLPPLDVVFLDKNKKRTLRTPSSACILIGDYPLTSQQLAPIKDILAEPMNWRDFLTNRVLFFLGLGLLALILIWYFFFRKKKTKSTRTQQVALAPKALALKRLEALANKNLHTTENWKAYYSELTFILRDFLEDSTQMKALESTSDEILRQLKNQPHHNMLEALRQLFERADLVKFAKGLPPADYHAEAMDVVRRFISKF